MSEDRAPVESVDRALQLVSILRDEQVLTVTHAADLLGVAPSTAHRLLAALVYRGYAVQASDRSYRAGPELGDRQSEAGRLRTLRTVARPALEQLHDTTGETVEVMALQGDNVCYLDGIESVAPLRVTARIGDLMPAHCAAGGKVLLADLSDSELDRLYERGLPPWPTAQITELQELKRHLRKVRRNGYASNVEESEEGVCALGVTVRDASDRAVAALVVALPSARFERRDVPRYLEALNAAAAVASRALPPPAAAGLEAR